MKNISLSCFMEEAERRHPRFTLCPLQSPENSRLTCEAPLRGSLMPKTHGALEDDGICEVETLCEK